MKKVKWIDSVIIEGQTDELPEPEMIETIGWERYIGRNDRDYIVIARDKIGDEYRGQIAIPKVNIINIEDIPEKS